jgi:hypothetical protein
MLLNKKILTGADISCILVLQKKYLSHCAVGVVRQKEVSATGPPRKNMAAPILPAAGCNEIGKCNSTSRNMEREKSFNNCRKRRKA